MPEDQPLLTLRAVTLVNLDTDSLSFALNLQHYSRHLWRKSPKKAYPEPRWGSVYDTPQAVLLLYYYMTW